MAVSEDQTEEALGYAADAVSIYGSGVDNNWWEAF